MNIHYIPWPLVSVTPAINLIFEMLLVLAFDFELVHILYGEVKPHCKCKSKAPINDLSDGTKCFELVLIVRI